MVFVQMTPLFSTIAEFWRALTMTLPERLTKGCVICSTQLFARVDSRKVNFLVVKEAGDRIFTVRSLCQN